MSPVVMFDDLAWPSVLAAAQNHQGIEIRIRLIRPRYRMKF